MKSFDDSSLFRSLTQQCARRHRPCLYSFIVFFFFIGEDLT